MNQQQKFDIITFALFGRVGSECIQKEICVACGKPAENFRTIKSSLAYLATALCQCCQDKVAAAVDKAGNGGDGTSHAE